MFIKTIPELYLNHTCSVPTPYFLRVEVPLSGESTAMVRSKYVSDRVQIENPRYPVMKKDTGDFNSNAFISLSLSLSTTIEKAKQYPAFPV